MVYHTYNNNDKIVILSIDWITTTNKCIGIKNSI